MSADIKNFDCFTLQRIHKSIIKNINFLTNRFKENFLHKNCRVGQKNLTKINFVEISFNFLKKFEKTNKNIAMH